MLIYAVPLGILAVAAIFFAALAGRKAGELEGLQEDFDAALDRNVLLNRQLMATKEELSNACARSLANADAYGEQLQRTWDLRFAVEELGYTVMWNEKDEAWVIEPKAKKRSRK